MVVYFARLFLALLICVGSFKINKSLGRPEATIFSKIHSQRFDNHEVLKKMNRLKSLTLSDLVSVCHSLGIKLDGLNNRVEVEKLIAYHSLARENNSVSKRFIATQLQNELQRLKKLDRSLLVEICDKRKIDTDSSLSDHELRVLIARNVIQNDRNNLFDDSFSTVENYWSSGDDHNENDKVADAVDSVVNFTNNKFSSTINFIENLSLTDTEIDARKAYRSDPIINNDKPEIVIDNSGRDDDDVSSVDDLVNQFLHLKTFDEFTVWIKSKSRDTLIAILSQMDKYPSEYMTKTDAINVLGEQFLKKINKNGAINTNKQHLNRNRVKPIDTWSFEKGLWNQMVQSWLPSRVVSSLNKVGGVVLQSFNGLFNQLDLIQSSTGSELKPWKIFENTFLLIGSGLSTLSLSIAKWASSGRYPPNVCLSISCFYTIITRQRFLAFLSSILAIKFFTTFLNTVQDLSKQANSTPIPKAPPTTKTTTTNNNNDDTIPFPNFNTK
jgi:hypothetical protein